MKLPQFQNNECIGGINLFLGMEGLKVFIFETISELVYA